MWTKPRASAKKSTQRSKHLKQNREICLCSAKWNSVIRLCSTAFVWNTILFIASSVNSDCTTTEYEYQMQHINSKRRREKKSRRWCMAVLLLLFFIASGAGKKSHRIGLGRKRIKTKKERRTATNQELNNSKPLHSASSKSTYMPSSYTLAG